MKYFKIVITALLVSSLSGCFSDETPNSDIRRESSFSKSESFDNINTLGIVSETIVIGRAVDTRATYLYPVPKTPRTEEYMERVKEAYTHIDLDVHEVIKGDKSLEGSLLTVMNVGHDTLNVSDLRSSTAPGMPRLELGEDYALFLRRFVDGGGVKTDLYVISGLNDGIFNFDDGVLSIPKDSSTLMFVDELHNTPPKLRGAFASSK